MKKTHIFVFVLLVIFTGGVLFITFYNIRSVAQEDPISIATAFPTQMFPDIDYQSPSDLGYTVVYLTADPETNMANLMQEYADIVLLSNWDEVLEYSANDDLDALLIDVSAAEWVDREWLGEAYRQGVMLVGHVGMHPVEGAELLNSNCAVEIARGIIPEGMEAAYQAYMNMGITDIRWSYRFIRAENTAQQALAEEIFFDTCSGDYEGIDYHAGGRDVEAFVGESDPTSFVKMGHRLAFSIQDFYEAKRAFENLASPVTPSAIVATPDAGG